MAATRLPANAIIGEAFAFVFGNLRPLARAAAVPFGIMTLSLLRMIWAERGAAIADWALVLWLLIQFAAVVPFQTQAYRFAVRATADSTPQLGWPWGRRETAFVLHALGLMLSATAVAAVAIGAVTVLTAPGPGASGEQQLAHLGVVALLAGLPTMAAVAYAGARVSIVFAAAAVGQRANWRTMWQATAGNGWRLFWIMLVAVLPWSLASGIVQAPAGLLNGVATMVVLGTAANILALFGMALPAVAIGLAYRHLAQAGAPPGRVSLLV